MRHLLAAKGATIVLLVVLALLPAAPARAGESFDEDFFAELTSSFEAWLTGWLAPSDQPTLVGTFPPNGDGLTEEPPAGAEISDCFPPGG